LIKVNYILFVMKTVSADFGTGLHPGLKLKNSVSRGNCLPAAVASRISSGISTGLMVSYGLFQG